MEVICRLCLKTVSDFQCKVIDDEDTVTNRQKINAFLPGLIIDIVDDPRICVFCAKLLEKFHDFRLVCLDTEEKIKRLIEDGHNIPVDLQLLIQQNRPGFKSEAKPANFRLKEENDDEVHLEKYLNVIAETTPLAENIDKERLNVLSIDQPNHPLENDNTIKLENVMDVNKNVQDEKSELKRSECETLEAKDAISKTASKYECVFCKLTFENKLSYLKHLPVHSDKVKCDVCSKTFHKHYQLKRHMKTHEKSYQCDMCDESFTNHKQLRQHRATHPKGPAICDVCNKTFTTRTHMREHMINVHAANITKKKFECQTCDESFYSKDVLLQHLKHHSSKKDYICDICGKEFLASLYLKRHKRQHTAIRTHQCPTCGMGFVVKHSLLEHLRTHSGEKPFKCDKCGKGFSQHGSLTTHLHSVHATEKRFACDLCPMKFMFKVSLRLHVQKHTGQVEKSHTCEVCGKSFRVAYALKTHSLRHTNGSTHTCLVCKKGFIGSGAVKRHMRTHTGEKPFECHICHFKCTQKYNLRVHINSHIRNRVSSATSATSSQVKRHQRNKTPNTRE